MGIVNLTDEPLSVVAEFFGADGGRLGSRTLEVEPLGFLQDNDPMAGFEAGPVDDAYAVVQSESATAP